ncbi:DUF488 family protein [uncultured Erythrobacter sp.]|uniref:DUF488 domain-containing protein n=1 Tax=uncultured Erythrobacter sp. TaxID=263913 RepID=UPI00260DB36F|nr:DUF488 domain-containing protein [uncultured Erythrobacter sp.]
MLSTIGYERASLEDFIATLRLGGIETLVDIRDRAQSRRKGFSKTALSEALGDAGIGYVHLKVLGDPKEGREAARSGDFAKFRQVFAGVMNSQGAQDAMLQLENMSTSSSICLMCYERDEKTCHRKIVSDSLEERTGLKTTHLGVKDGAGRRPSIRRVHDTYQGTAASL